MAVKIMKVKPAVPVLPKRKRVAAYARVSCVKDAMHMSLANQVSHYSALIQRNPAWQYVGVFADDGYTGTKDARPEFQRLLAACRAGQVDLVITKSMSRFSRNTLSTLELLRELKVKGVDVFFEEENIHTMSGDGELMLTILSSFAQEESRSVSENCKWRIRNRMKDGEIVGLRDMYGYEISKGVIQINAEQAAIVRRVFHDYVSGGMSSARIAKALQADEIPSLFGGQWTAKRVREMLKNEKYIGDALLQKRYVVDHLTKREARNHGELPQYYAEETHPAIIDPETFRRAQEILAMRRDENRASKPPTTRYPFSGMVRCGNCGEMYRRKTCHGKVAWQCGTYLSEGKAFCAAKQVPEDTLIRSTAIAMDMPAFDPAAFAEQISAVVVAGPNSLLYEFKDGRSVEIGWKDRSRRESWTPEMKKQARERDRLRREDMNHGSKAESNED